MVPLLPRKFKVLIKVDMKMTVRQMAQLQQASLLELEMKITDRQMAPLFQASQLELDMQWRS